MSGIRCAVGFHRLARRMLLLWTRLSGSSSIRRGPSCLLLDLRMQGMHGHRGASRLERGRHRSADRSSSPAMPTSPTTVEAMQRGAIDLMEKPLQGKDLVAHRAGPGSGLATARSHGGALRSGRPLGSLVQRRASRGAHAHRRQVEPRNRRCHLGIGYGARSKTAAANIMLKMRATVAGPPGANHLRHRVRDFRRRKRLEA